MHLVLWFSPKKPPISSSNTEHETHDLNYNYDLFLWHAIKESRVKNEFCHIMYLFSGIKMSCSVRVLYLQKMRWNFKMEVKWHNRNEYQPYWVKLKVPSLIKNYLVLTYLSVRVVVLWAVSVGAQGIVLLPYNQDYCQGFSTWPIHASI